MSIYKCKYFQIEELVCNHVLQSYSENQIWSFLDEDLKKTIDSIREVLNVPLTVNQPKLQILFHGYMWMCGEMKRGKRCIGLMCKKYES